MSEAPTAPELQYPPPPPQPAPIYTPPPPRPRPTFPRLSLGHLAWIVAAAVLTNLALRSGVASLSSLLAVIVIVGPLLGTSFRRNPTAAGFALAAVIFAAWLPLRSSTWLTSLNAAAVAACMIAAASTARPVSLRLSTKTLRTILSRISLARFFVPVLAQAAAPFRVLRANRLVPILRGAAIAVVPVVVLGALLASADEVFSQAFSPEIDPSSFFEHTFLTLLALAAIAALVAITSDPAEESFEERKPLGATEALVLLVSVGGLYGAFAVVQLLSAIGRVDHLLDQRNLTYSEYARSGFFQLLWVAGLTIVLLGVVRLLVTDGTSKVDAAVRIAGAVVALLTTLIVAVAIVRLGLYTDEFGQTTLRWYCTAFAWMLGALFLVLAIGHLRRTEAALPIAMLGVVAITLFAVNVLNPEARVATHNLDRIDAVDALDALYLSGLSADAWPQILDERQLVASRLVGGESSVDQLCGIADEPNGYGPFGFNLARSRLYCGG